MSRAAIAILLICVALLAGLGLAMIASTGGYSIESGDDMHRFVKKQAIMLAVGVIVILLVSLVDYNLWTRRIFGIPLWGYLAIATLIMLLICFVPRNPLKIYGLTLNGSRRWISIFGASFQPSELAKITSFFFLAWWFSHYRKNVSEFWKGFIFPLAIVGAFCLPILGEVDMGTFALILGTTLCVMLVAGTRLIYLGGTVIVGVAALIALAYAIPQRLARIVAFLDLEKYKDTEGLQQWMALIAFGSGGPTGVGFGEGRQKMLYLPYAHTDFIFAMIGEELGLGATLLTVLGFLLIALCGIIIALHARERFGLLLATGCTLCIALQAFVNIGVNIAVLPNKGMPLPFISYGGTGLLVSCFMIGLLVSIHLYGRIPRSNSEEILDSYQS